MATDIFERQRTQTKEFEPYQKTELPFEETESSFSPVFEDDNATFEVQKNYNFDTDNVFDKPENKEMSMPSIEKNELTFAKPQTDAKIRLRARAKIALSVYAIVLVSLIAFAIFNTFALTDARALVQDKTNELYRTEQVINDLSNEYNSLGSDETILEKTEGVFFEPTETDIVVVSRTEMATRTETQVQSNWFEELCKFFSRIFG